MPEQEVTTNKNGLETIVPTKKDDVTEDWLRKVAELSTDQTQIDKLPSMYRGFFHPEQTDKTRFLEMLSIVGMELSQRLSSEDDDAYREQHRVQTNLREAGKRFWDKKNPSADNVYPPEKNQKMLDSWLTSAKDAVKEGE